MGIIDGPSTVAVSRYYSTVGETIFRRFALRKKNNRLVKPILRSITNVLKVAVVAVTMVAPAVVTPNLTEAVADLRFAHFNSVKVKRNSWQARPGKGAEVGWSPPTPNGAC